MCRAIFHWMCFISSICWCVDAYFPLDVLYILHTLVCGGLFSLGCATLDLYTTWLSDINIRTNHVLTSHEGCICQHWLFSQGDVERAYRLDHQGQHWFSSGQCDLGCSARKLNWLWYVTVQCCGVVLLSSLYAYSDYSNPLHKEKQTFLEIDSPTSFSHHSETQ